MDVSSKEPGNVDGKRLQFLSISLPEKYGAVGEGEKPDGDCSEKKSGGEVEGAKSEKDRFYTEEQKTRA